MALAINKHFVPQKELQKALRKFSKVDPHMLQAHLRIRSPSCITNTWQTLVLCRILAEDSIGLAARIVYSVIMSSNQQITNYNQLNSCSPSSLQGHSILCT